MLFLKNILFGLFEKTLDKNSVYLINLFILIAKFHIHCCKYLG